MLLTIISPLRYTWGWFPCAWERQQAEPRPRSEAGLKTFVINILRNISNIDPIFPQYCEPLRLDQYNVITHSWHWAGWFCSRRAGLRSLRCTCSAPSRFGSPGVQLCQNVTVATPRHYLFGIYFALCRWITSPATSEAEKIQSTFLRG